MARARLEDPLMVVKGIFHPVVSVADMATSVRYYRDALGLKVSFDDYHDPAAISQLFGLSEPRVRSVVVSCPDGSEIELVEYERPRGRTRVEREPQDAGLLAINLRVDGMEDLRAAIQAAGFGFGSPIVEQTLPDGGVIKVLVSEAPDGVTIILVELPADRGSLASPGAA
ncbi:MAG TPA: VOC family protein [Candidatus Saccharimonadales bacterium]|nr:VOC family protein [Candidatus Saccharimonadales bacterium]